MELVLKVWRRIAGAFLRAAVLHLTGDTDYWLFRVSLLWIFGLSNSSMLLLILSKKFLQICDFFSASNLAIAMILSTNVLHTKLFLDVCAILLLIYLYPTYRVIGHHQLLGAIVVFCSAFQLPPTHSLCSRFPFNIHDLLSGNYYVYMTGLSDRIEKGLSFDPGFRCNRIEGSS